MAEAKERPNEARTEAQVVIDNYVPGSALAAIDAGMARLDALYNDIIGKATQLMSQDIPTPSPSQTSPLAEPSVDAVVDYLKTCKNVLVLTGAGISTSAGIPDFRTPGTGLYSNIESYLTKFNINSPQELFSYTLFLENPEPFFDRAKDQMYPPEQARPTLAHYFIKLLEEKGCLLRNYTQNIDMLQSKTGLSDDKIFECHGSFRSGTCMKCKVKFNQQQVKNGIFSGSVPRCKATVNEMVCDGVIKPDIVMFGENLSQEYLVKSSVDVGKCDMLIVMGTSLTVGPVNRIPNEIPPSTPRLILNSEKICTDIQEATHTNCPMFWFDHEGNKTDVFMGGDIDQSVMELMEKLGWTWSHDFPE